MRKIETLFRRIPNSPLVEPVFTPGCEWVAEGAGTPYEKIDGTACCVRAGTLYKRLQVRNGKEPSPGWIHWSLAPEQRTGHGWVPIGDGPEDQWHNEAWALNHNCPDGTYELVGPRIQRNPYQLGAHELWSHTIQFAGSDPPRDFDGIRAFLEANVIEGIVWHHPGGAMAKIKRRDFGLPWPVPEGDCR